MHSDTKSGDAAHGQDGSNESSQAHQVSVSNTASIQISPMGQQDRPWFELLCAEVFGPGRFARAAFRVREQIADDPRLAMVASINGEKMGGVLMTPISLSGVDGYLLGPLVTATSARNKGAGRALVRAACDAVFSDHSSLKNADRFVLLVGDAAYYEPLGFDQTQLGSITFPGAVDPARILAHCGAISLGRDSQAALALHGPVRRAQNFFQP